MRIAVVGAGIAGLGAAWLLSRQHEVVLYEAETRLGGHTDTHDIVLGSRRYAIDTGFIVFNPENYPLLTRLFLELGVASQATQMSFSVHSAATGLQYNAGTLSGLFCQKRNLVSPRFWQMLADLRRFYREAPALLATPDAGPSLGDYLDANGYRAAFVHDHLVPMASALWSSPTRRVLDFPTRYLVEFMANHRMLDIAGRPEWRVVSGGSSSYVRAISARWPVQVRLDSAVTRVAREAAGVRVATAGADELFDHVVLACHADQALSLLAVPTAPEHEVLGAIRYQANETILHTDASLLPPDRRAWAAWNAYRPASGDGPCTVSYCMNILQSIRSPEPFVVSLNRTEAIDPGKILARRRYQHPVYTQESVAAQARRAEVNGVDRIWFAGAYWGWGFHEDGLRSAVDVAARLGVSWPEAPQ
jgi:predicted NAD/FAD-binding protein